MKAEERLSLSRRGFMKGVLATTAASAMYGFTGKQSTAFAQVPSLNDCEVIYNGTSPHNCGGRCVLRAHVKNGVVKRFTTDERPDINMIDTGLSSSQRRACVRCRSKKDWLYRTDRLLYPLKQTKERGDMTGFAKISWEQAFTEIAQNLKDIQAREKAKFVKQGIANATGAEGFYFHYSTGDGASFPRARPLSERLLQMLGGSYYYRDDYSYPSHYFAGRFFGGNSNQQHANSMPDIKNAELLVLWSWNGSENIQNTNSSWFATQARDMGIPVISVDQWISKTTHTIATGLKDAKGKEIVSPLVAPMSGTDSALVAAMVYHLLKTDKLDIEFIKKYTHGFFDDPEAKDVAGGDNGVPAGASYSAYVFGDENTLVTKKLNKATSVYPDAIGYNVADSDPLKGKYAPMYGQTPKTPEWAEQITGVPAATIKALAEAIATKKTTIWVGGGFQRSTEGEQNIWSVNMLGIITKNFGQPGAATGMSSAGVGNPPKAPGMPPLDKKYTDVMAVTKANIMKMKGFDVNAITYQNSASAGMKIGNDSTFPCFIWQDAVQNGGTGKSMWNSPEVANGPAIKVLLNFGGNCVINQCGDVHKSQEVTKDKSRCELVVSTDFFMNVSCLYSDYVLPAAMPFEKTIVATMDEAVLISPQAVNPPAEVLSDFDITMGIADKLGFKDDIFKIDGTSYYKDIDAIRARYTPHEGLSFDEFKKAGILTPGVNAKVKITYDKYLEDPIANKLSTPSGKFECYSKAAVENYEARGYNNIDANVTLKNGTISTKKNMNSNKGRYVYAIPMYIPLVEGRHACDNGKAQMWQGKVATIDNKKSFGATQHPDLLGSNAKGYKLRLHTWHMMYRSHSTLGTNGFLTELYKMDSKGQPTMMRPDRPQELVFGKNGVMIDENVYEPIFISQNLGKTLGITETNGKLVHLYNDRGAIRVFARVSKLVPEGEIMIGQGSWTQFESKKTVINKKEYYVDRGGNANTLYHIRPTRICQGMTLANDCKVGIELA